MRGRAEGYRAALERSWSAAEGWRLGAGSEAPGQSGPPASPQSSYVASDSPLRIEANFKPHVVAFPEQASRRCPPKRRFEVIGNCGYKSLDSRYAGDLTLECPGLSVGNTPNLSYTAPFF